MRFYAKLLAMTALFACACAAPVRQAASELAYEARVAFVLRFGSDADYDALLDDTQRMWAAEQGNLPLYHAGKRFQQLLADRRRAGGEPSEEEVQELAKETFCAVPGDGLEHLRSTPTTRPVPLADATRRGTRMQKSSANP